jgi:dynein light chain Tctex-type 1
MVPQWTSDVVEGVMKKLTGLQKPFKYIGTPVPRRLASLPRRRRATAAAPPLPADGPLAALLLAAVSCVIMQKNGAGLHTASSCFWDNQTDGSCTVRQEYKTMYCIVTVFGLGI